MNRNLGWHCSICFANNWQNWRKETVAILIACNSSANLQKFKQRKFLFRLKRLNITANMIFSRRGESHCQKYICSQYRTIGEKSCWFFRRVWLDFLRDTTHRITVRDILVSLLWNTMNFLKYSPSALNRVKIILRYCRITLLFKVLLYCIVSLL